MMWKRRWILFCSHRRALISAVFLATFTFFSFTAEIWSNDKPLVLSYAGRLYFPVFRHYEPQTFRLNGTMVVDYKTLELGRGDWALWPVNRWDPYHINKSAGEFPSPPDGRNWLGTDDRGRDVFARLLYGYRYSLIYAICVWLVCSGLALAYGGICGFFGHWIDLLGQRLVEILATIPQLLLLIFIVSIFEPSMKILVSVSCAFGWIGLSYFVRAEVLRTSGQDYVAAARALGASSWHVFRHHILPNSIVPLVTFAPFMVVANIMALAGLDFMGLGLPAPTPSWGELIQQTQTYFTWAWWLAFFPAFLLFLTLLSLNFFGEGVRSAFDPSAKIVEKAGAPESAPVKEPLIRKSVAYRARS